MYSSAEEPRVDVRCPVHTATKMKPDRVFSEEFDGRGGVPVLSPRPRAVVENHTRETQDPVESPDE